MIDKCGGGCYSEYHQVAPDNRSGGLRSFREDEMCTDNVCKVGTPPAVPQDNQTRSSLNEAGRELVRALESALVEQAFSRAKAREDSLERRIAALEKKSQETVRSPETSDHVVQKIAELRESLEDSCCPQGDKSSSSSKEEEHFLVAPIRGIDEDGCLILGDRKILSASALKI